MNAEQVVGTIRQFLPFIAGIVTAMGWNKDGKFNTLADALIAAIGPGMALISVVWSFFSKTNAALVSKAANVPGVASITLENTVDGRALAPNSVTPSNVQVGK